MDYESRQLRWYWVALFIIYSAGVVYLLFAGNPYLYSHHELRESLLAGESGQIVTIPSSPKADTPPGQASFHWRYNDERSAIDELGSTRSKNYLEFERHPVEHGIEGLDIQHLTSDASGFFITGKMPWAVAIGMDGKPLWKYRSLDLASEHSLLPILLDQTSAYIVHPKGSVVSLNKTSGDLNWMMELGQDVIAQPFIWQNHLIVPTKGLQGVSLRRILRASGKPEAETPTLDIKPAFLTAYGSILKSMILSVDNKVISLDTKDWSVTWTQSLTEPVRGPAVIIDNFVFITTLAGKLVKLDGKRGKVEWEIDLEKPPASSPSYLPVLDRLVFLDTDGAMVTVDAKTGKVFWRNNVENRNSLVETWSARLKGNHIEEFGMDWLHKGWTIWSPCYVRKFCIFTPAKGQLIARIDLAGTPLTLPQNVDRRLVFFTEVKPGKYLISHTLETSEIKKLRMSSQDEEKSSIAVKSE